MPQVSERRSVRVVQFVKGEIQSADLVRYVLSASDVDTVLHFAAQVGISKPCWSAGSCQCPHKITKSPALQDLSSMWDLIDAAYLINESNATHSCLPATSLPSIDVLSSDLSFSMGECLL